MQESGNGRAGRRRHAAPILFASLMPRSCIFPIITDSTRGPSPEEASTAAPAAVAVHCAEGGRWPPYSNGRRNCFSAEQKCEEVEATASPAVPVSINTDAIKSDSAIVEQAPYSPANGISSSRMPKHVPIHWLKRSPAKITSTSAGLFCALLSARITASRCSLLSAFSQETSPKVVSSKYGQTPPQGGLPLPFCPPPQQSPVPQDGKAV